MSQEDPIGFTPSEMAQRAPGIASRALKDTILSERQAVIATGVLASYLVTQPMKLLQLFVKVGTTGTVTDTVVDVNVNGASVMNTAITVGNAEADGTSRKSSDFSAVDLVPGDTVNVEVTTAPTGGANLDFALEVLR